MSTRRRAGRFPRRERDRSRSYSRSRERSRTRSKAKPVEPITRLHRQRERVCGVIDQNDQLILRFQLNLEAFGFSEMDRITDEVMESINSGGTQDSKTATMLMTDFAGALFDKLWDFTDRNIVAVETKTCFDRTGTLREICRGDLHPDDYINLIPKSLDEDCLDWCMSILLL